MTTLIQQDETDDAALVVPFDQLILDLATRIEVSCIIVVRINNWFDEKWYGFAGKKAVVVESGIPNHNTRVDPFWRGGTEVTVPPFTPNRVLTESWFLLREGQYVSSPVLNKPMHPREKRASHANLPNRLLDISENAMFIWFSANSRTNGRASALSYRTRVDHIGGWYASFRRNGTWKVDRVRGIDRTVIANDFADCERRCQV